MPIALPGSRALARHAAVAVLLSCAAASAGTVYRWTDKQGITHYGDRAPPAGAAPDRLRRIHVATEPTAIARLRIEPGDDRYLAWAENRLAGPIEVRLRFRSRRNIVSNPALPARATVPAAGALLVAVLQAERPGAGGDFEVSMDSLPGDPAARPLDVEYLLPLARPTRVDQGYGGRFSHTDGQNRYAVDFAAPLGSTVLAARAGTVMQVESGFEASGLNLARYGGRANYIRIVHDDGTMGVYAHLKADGVLVRPGQRVRAGQAIGLSGNTGYTTGPHLHFVVQVNRGMRLESVPFRMRGPRGPLRIKGAHQAGCAPRGCSGGVGQLLRQAAPLRQTVEHADRAQVLLVHR